MHPLSTHRFPKIDAYNKLLNVNRPLLFVATLLSVMWSIHISSIDSHPNMRHHIGRIWIDNSLIDSLIPQSSQSVSLLRFTITLTVQWCEFTLTTLLTTHSQYSLLSQSHITVASVKQNESVNRRWLTYELQKNVSMCITELTNEYSTDWRNKIERWTVTDSSGWMNKSERTHVKRFI